MRFSTILTSIREALGNRQYTGVVCYRGTNNTTAVTELFIDGQPSRRLVPALDSGGVLNIEGLVYRSGVVFTTSRRYLYTCSPAGVILLTDLGESARAAAGPSGAVVPVAPVLGATATAGVTGCQLTVVPATAIAPAFLRVDVSSATNATAYWELTVSFTEAGIRG